SALARHYVQAIRTQQPYGPYRVGGASSAGVIALEIARVLRADGDEVERLVLVDPTPVWLWGTTMWLRFRVRMLLKLSGRDAVRWICASLRRKLSRRGQPRAAHREDSGEPLAKRIARLSGNLEYITRGYRPAALDVPAIAIVTRESQHLWGDRELHWTRLIRDLTTP